MSGPPPAPAGGTSCGPADQPGSDRLRSAMLLMGTGYLLLTLCDYREGIAGLALRYLLKDELQLTATQLAGFFLITKLAWYCKPFAGLLADKVRFLGSRRKGYLVVFSVIGGGLWLALAFFHHTYLSMLWLVLAINFALMMVHTTLGGLLVEVSQSLGATGRISAVRSGTESFGWLLAGLVGGWIAVHLLHHGFLINAALMIVLAVIFAKMLREDKEPGAGPETPRWTLGLFKELFQHRTLWAATGFWVLVKFSPGFGTPLFFIRARRLA